MRKLDVKFDPALIGIAEVWVPTGPDSQNCQPVYLYDADKMEGMLMAQGATEDDAYEAVQDIFQAAWKDDHQTPVYCYSHTPSYLA